MNICVHEFRVKCVSFGCKVNSKGKGVLSSSLSHYCDCITAAPTPPPGKPIPLMDQSHTTSISELHHHPTRGTFITIFGFPPSASIALTLPLYHDYFRERHCYHRLWSYIYHHQPRPRPRHQHTNTPVGRESNRVKQCCRSSGGQARSGGRAAPIIMIYKWYYYRP